MSVTSKGVGLTFEVGFVDNAFKLDDSVRGVLDSSKLKPDWSWTDISDSVLTLATSRGRQKPADKFNAGTCTLTLKDQDRRFDATNSSSPYAPNVQPAKPLRITATYNAVSYGIWWGFIDAWTTHYTKGVTGGLTTVEVQATDVFKQFAQITPQGLASQGAGEMSGARVNRALNLADWPTSQRAVDPGTVALIGTSFQGTVMDELDVTMYSEGGIIHQDGSGVLVFDDRSAPFGKTEQRDSQATFGETEVSYFDIAAAFDDSRVVNDVTLSTAPGKTIQKVDSTSQALYGQRSFSVTGLMNANAADLVGLADQMLTLDAEAQPRFDALTLRPQRAPTTMWPQVLGRKIHDRLTVRRRPPGGGVVELSCFIEGIDHSTEANGVWETTFYLSAAPVAVFTSHPLLLDDPVFGQIDSTNVLV